MLYCRRTVGPMLKQQFMLYWSVLSLLLYLDWSILLSTLLLLRYF